MRRAIAAGRPAIEAFLRGRIGTSTFPLSNLARHETGGGHPRAMRFWIAGDPVAAVPDCVQVSAVWMPPALRGQGRARAAGALLLAEARAGGASRAYRALGFREGGPFALLVFPEALEVRPG